MKSLNSEATSGIELSLIVPIYNELDNIPRLLDECLSVLRAQGRSFEIIAVDDGSRDGSRDLLQIKASEIPELKVILLRRNSGQTAAFDAGFSHARGQILLTIDADLQNDPKDIPMLLAKLEEGFDVVAGWRKDRHDGFLLRRLPSIIANKLIRKVTKTKVHDQGCSLRAYRREITQELNLYGEMHRFIVPLAEIIGARVTEVVVNHRPRYAGQSKYGINRTLKVLLDLLTVIFLRSYQAKPIYLFGGMSFGLFAIATLLSAVVLWEKWVNGAFVHRNPLFILSMICLLVAVQLLALGILAEIMIRIYFESQNKKPYSIAKILGAK